MTAKMTMLAAMIWVAGAALPLAQGPVTKANVLKINATIQAIDASTRMITLRDDKGNEDSFSVGEGVTRFNELKVGQKVNITYYESIVFQLVKPGEKGSGESFEAALNRAKSALPAGTVATQDKATVTVKAVDPAVPSITVTTADGRVVTRKIENKKNIEGVKPGDKIDITYTRAIVTSVENAK
jgi:Cu/Ag efflux protein CusF